MTTPGRMIRIDSNKATPSPADLPDGAAIRHRAEMDIIDELAMHNVRRSVENYQLATQNAVCKSRVTALEAVIDALLLAIDSGGPGFAGAVGAMRRVRRGSEAKETPR